MHSTQPLAQNIIFEASYVRAATTIFSKVIQDDDKHEITFISCIVVKTH